MKISWSFLPVLFFLNTLYSLELVILENQMPFSVYVWFEYEYFVSGAAVEYLQVQKVEPSEKKIFYLRARIKSDTIILSKMHIHFLKKHYEVARDFFFPMAVPVIFRNCGLSMAKNYDLLISCKGVMNLQQKIRLREVPIETVLFEKVKYYEEETVKQMEYMKQVLKDYNAASKKD